VYDNAGNIVYIIPPKAVVKMTATISYNTSSYPELIYQFKYDNKKSHKAKESTRCQACFNNIRSIRQSSAYQDGNMFSGSNGTNWSYLKYDNANRVIIQGIYTYSGTLLHQ